MSDGFGQPQVVQSSIRSEDDVQYFGCVAEHVFCGVPSVHCVELQPLVSKVHAAVQAKVPPNPGISVPQVSPP